METRSNNARQGSTRIITAQQVSQRLRAAIIPNTGANKLPLVGSGNSFTRENGTQVRIFNVLAFATQADAQEAKKLFLEGMELERQGLVDTDDCQDKYKAAYNKLMNFSVLAQDEHRFVEFGPDGRAILKCFEVECRIEWGTTREGKPMLQINAARPAKVETAGERVDNMFNLPADMAYTQQPAPQPAPQAQQPEPVLAGGGTEQQEAAQTPQAPRAEDLKDANIPEPITPGDENTPF